MDEAEKYKQRIEAIAEKRRLQEEQDRARREEEDEKLRLQQFKRKSLRDKWLMEGAPLSPTFLDTQTPRSPPWVTQAQNMEKHIEKSQSENRQLAEEQEKLVKQTEDGQTEAFKVSQAGEVVSDVARNGENNSTGSDTTEDDVAVNQGAPLDESEVVVTNGGENTDYSASDQNNQSLANGPTGDGVISMEMETNLGVSKADPVKVPNTNVKKEEEEEEGTLVMRAECIFITDDGDDVPGEVVSQADQQEPTQSDKVLLPNPEAAKEGGEAVEEKVQTETFTESEKSEAFGNIDGSIQENPGEGGKVKAEDQDKELEEPTCVQSPTNPLESTVVTLVPVYTEAQPSNLSPELEAQAEDSAVAPEEPELVSKPQEATCLPVQFQDVPLTDAQENQRTEDGPGEQEPLLLNTKAPSTMVEPAGTDSPASVEAQSPTRASQGEVIESPKPKTCLCCSVM
ncbi:paralemmin-3 isoform X2 [Archocentrus centrarchus]|uniref:paralemmin-3 isoform X2 n=1 Tax=Archocentrus centrarchus TaxID=63155 RepID=UPI0011E9F5F4|nr:paralemmin-1-like isoform X2 [Archocentrus centrarchus]